MIIVETPISKIDKELEILQSVPEGPDADFIEGAMVALLWIRDGVNPPHKSLGE